MYDYCQHVIDEVYEYAYEREWTWIGQPPFLNIDIYENGQSYYEYDEHYIQLYVPDYPDRNTRKEFVHEEYDFFSKDDRIGNVKADFGCVYTALLLHELAHAIETFPRKISIPPGFHVIDVKILPHEIEGNNIDEVREAHNPEWQYVYSELRKKFLTHTL